MQDVDNERNCMCEGKQGVYGSSLYFPFNLAVNLKLLRKRKSILFKKLIRNSRENTSCPKRKSTHISLHGSGKAMSRFYEAET